MAKKRISAKNLAVLTASNLVLSAAVGASASYIMDWPTGWTIAATNLASLTPLLLASGDALRQELGLSSPSQITGNWSKRTFGRQIPINAGDKQSNIFMNVLQIGSGNTPEPEEIAELESVSIWYNENDYIITMPDLEEFIFVAYRRQSQNKHGFSRRYWTEQRRPTITTLEYDVRMFLLCSVDGLIINRSASRSGKLTLPPTEAIKKIKAAY